MEWAKRSGETRNDWGILVVEFLVDCCCYSGFVQCLAFDWRTGMGIGRWWSAWPPKSTKRMNQLRIKMQKNLAWGEAKTKSAQLFGGKRL